MGFTLFLCPIGHQRIVLSGKLFSLFIMYLFYMRVYTDTFFRTTDQIILSNLKHMDGLNAIYMQCHSNEKYSRYKNDPLLFESILSNDVTMWRKGRGIKWKCIQYTWMSVRWCEWFYFIYFCHGEGKDFDVSGLLQVFLAVISSFCYYRCLFTIQRYVFLLN